MGIYIAAIITTLTAFGLFGYLIFRLSPRDRHAVCLVAAVAALPLQPPAFHLVRVPLDQLLHGWLGTSAGYLWLTTLYAPLTEEPAKWLVLLIPLVRRSLRQETVVPIALAVGLGFGTGEIWFLAREVAKIPDYAALPFWMFGGFFMERLLVVFLHGAIVSFAFYNLAAGRSFLLGGIIGMALHYLLNLPIFLAALQAFGLSPTAWQSIAGLWPFLLAGLLGVLLNRMSDGRFRAEAMGFSTCPECGTVYPRPLLLALNLGPRRYERCPNCRRFHLVSVFQGKQPTAGDKSGGA